MRSIHKLFRTFQTNLLGAEVEQGRTHLDLTLCYSELTLRAKHLDRPHQDAGTRYSTVVPQASKLALGHDSRICDIGW